MEQIAFRIGGLTIYWYGVLIAAGFLAGLWTASRRAPNAGISGEVIMDLGPWLLLSAILVSRLHYVIVFWHEEFATQPLWEVFMIHHGGLIFFGGLIGGALATIFYARAKGLPLWKLGDVLTPSLALGQAFGRVGCFMRGCCFGLPSSVPWAVSYPVGHVTHPERLHPAQLYESALNLCLYGALAWVFRRRRFDGQVFAVYLIAYGSLRTTVEFFRGDYQTRYLGGWMSSGQAMSLVALAAGAWLYRVRRGVKADA